MEAWTALCPLGIRLRNEIASFRRACLQDSEIFPFLAHFSAFAAFHNLFCHRILSQIRLFQQILREVCSVTNLSTAYISSMLPIQIQGPSNTQSLPFRGVYFRHPCWYVRPCNECPCTRNQNLPHYATWFRQISQAWFQSLHFTVAPWSEGPWVSSLGMGLSSLSAPERDVSTPSSCACVCTCVCCVLYAHVHIDDRSILVMSACMGVIVDSTLEWMHDTCTQTIITCSVRCKCKHRI